MLCIGLPELEHTKNASHNMTAKKLMFSCLMFMKVKDKKTTQIDRQRVPDIYERRNRAFFHTLLASWSHYIFHSSLCCCCMCVSLSNSVNYLNNLFENINLAIWRADPHKWIGMENYRSQTIMNKWLSERCTLAHAYTHGATNLR